MPAMTDPHDGLVSFQDALTKGLVSPGRGELDPDLLVLVDSPAGEARLTYARVDGGVVTAFAVLVRADPVAGMPCFGIGWAVPAEMRGQGRARDVVHSAIRELRHGLGRNGVTAFHVEAVVGEGNAASRGVAERVIAPVGKPVTDGVSGLPAIQYLRKVATE